MNRKTLNEKSQDKAPLHALVGWFLGGADSA